MTTDNASREASIALSTVMAVIKFLQDQGTIIPDDLQKILDDAYSNLVDFDKRNAFAKKVAKIP